MRKIAPPTIADRRVAIRSEAELDHGADRPAGMAHVDGGRHRAGQDHDGSEDRRQRRQRDDGQSEDDSRAGEAHSANPGQSKDVLAIGSTRGRKRVASAMPTMPMEG